MKAVDDELLRRLRATFVTKAREAEVRAERLAASWVGVDRTLPAAAQHERRALPQHRWESPAGGLDVLIEENEGGRLIVTVSAQPEVTSDAVVAVCWMAEDDEGVIIADELVTPLAPSRSSTACTAMYDVGSAESMRRFGVQRVELREPREVTPAVLRHALQAGPYGNAMRAWEHLTTHHDDQALRALYDEIRGTYLDGSSGDGATIADITQRGPAGEIVRDPSSPAEAD